VRTTKLKDALVSVSGCMAVSHGMQEAAVTKQHGCGYHKSLPTSMLPMKQLDSIFLHRFYRAKSLWSLALAKRKTWL
jgi:hypothetical protein